MSDAFDPSVSFRDLLNYNNDEMLAWAEWLREHHAAQEVPVGGKAGTVLGLYAHVAAAEIFLLARVKGATPDPADYTVARTVDEAFAMHRRAQAGLEGYVERMTEEELGTIVEFPVRADLAVSRRKVLVQAIMHGVHHRAQMAMALRQAGMPRDRMNDYILSPVVV